MGDHWSRARTTTATVDWLPRPTHVWLQLHRQMVPRLFPLEAMGKKRGLCLRGTLLRHFLFHNGDPSEALRPKPQPREKQPMKALPGPIWVPGGQSVQSWAHSPTTSSFTNASPSTLRPDTSEPSEKTNSTSHTLWSHRRCWLAIPCIYKELLIHLMGTIHWGPIVGLALCRDQKLQPKTSVLGPGGV